VPILHDCVVREIAFVPFCPLGWPRLQHEQIRTDPVITASAQAHSRTPAQIALAWLLALAPKVLLIPGTSKRTHLAENLQVGTVALHPDQMTALTERFT
jgi:pyridoxine 4-dehydrogenase